MLIEETIKTNIGIEEVAHYISLAQSLTKIKRPKLTKFFTKRQINFAWSYVDMPRLVTNLVMHHLTVTPGAKPVRHKL